MKIEMKRLLVMVWLCGWAMIGNSQSIYTQSFTDIDGGSVSLSTYQGKKILFMIAPLKEADSLKLNEIVAFAAKYPDSVKMVGIMSIEDGYVDSNKASIKSMYQGKGINMVLTQGMLTHRDAGTNQGTIMKWLTSRALNKRFSDDAGGVGQMFFVNEMGNLYSVLIAQTSLISPAVDRNLKRKL